MHPELEALVRAYDAVQESLGPEAPRLRTVFEGRVEDALAKRSGLSRESLLNLIRLQHRRWVRAQQTPTTLPPKA